MKFNLQFAVAMLALTVATTASPLAPVAGFDLTISQPGGPGTGVVLADTGGSPFGQVINAIALAPGSYPNGWFFGVDITFPQLVAQISAGPPFNVGLDGAGAYSIGPILGVPPGLQLWYVGVEFAGDAVVNTSNAKTVTFQ